MADVVFRENDLKRRDAALARRFEEEIASAATAVRDEEPLGCRILAWQRSGDLGTRSRVTIQFDRPGWVKLVSVPLRARPGQVRAVAAQALAHS